MLVEGRETYSLNIGATVGQPEKKNSTKCPGQLLGNQVFNGKMKRGESGREEDVCELSGRQVDRLKKRPLKHVSFSS
jgi:hypothetical protein